MSALVTQGYGTAAILTGGLGIAMANPTDPVNCTNCGGPADHLGVITQTEVGPEGKDTIAHRIFKCPSCQYRYFYVVNPDGSRTQTGRITRDGLVQLA